MKRITLGGVDVATEVTFPNWCRRATMYFFTNAGKVATVGSHGNPIDANFAPVVANDYWNIFVDRDPNEGGKGPASLFLASGTAGTVVLVIAESG
jgi:hypothetical protein